MNDDHGLVCVMHKIESATVALVNRSTMCVAEIIPAMQLPGSREYQTPCRPVRHWSSGSQTFRMQTSHCNCNRNRTRTPHTRSTVGQLQRRINRCGRSFRQSSERQHVSNNSIQGSCVHQTVGQGGLKVQRQWSATESSRDPNSANFSAP